MSREIEVRVPFSLDNQGKWNALMWSDQALDHRAHRDNERTLKGRVVYRCWIVARIEVPDEPVPEVRGEVEP